MKIPCCYVTIVVDKNGEDIVAFPKIIESFIIDEKDDKYIVQIGASNAHLVSVKKDKVFLSKEKAQAHIFGNKELQEQCENAREWYINYRKNKTKGVSH